MFILSRKKFLLIAFSAFFLYFLLYKLQYLYDCSYTTGKIVSFSGNSKGVPDPVVEIKVRGKTFHFKGDPGINDYEGQAVSVAYKTRDPRQAKIFSFMGFWWTGVIYAIFPLIIFAALILSVVSKNEKIVIDYTRYLKKKADREPFRFKIKTGEDGSGGSDVAR